MHRLTTLETEYQIAQLSSLLRAAGIRYAVELKRAKTYEKFDIILICTEDRPRAERLLKKFEANLKPERVDFGLQEEPIMPAWRLSRTRAKSGKRSRPVSWTLGLICIALFLIQDVQWRQIRVREERIHVDMVIFTPLVQWTLIDFPKAFSTVVKFQDSLPQRPNPSLNDETQTQKEIYRKMGSTPYWGGIYPWLIARATGKSAASHTGKLFEKIRKGHVWRFFTPGFIHESLAYLFFNLFWLWAIGSIIERKIGPNLYLGLITIILITTNIAQYLVSGPIYGGLAGVSCGFIGFIFARRQVAPWENYRVEPALFWLFFGYVSVLAMVQLSLFSMALLGASVWPLRIPSTAHITGLLIGYALGRTRTFVWKAKR